MYKIDRRGGGQKSFSRNIPSYQKKIISVKNVIILKNKHSNYSNQFNRRKFTGQNNMHAVDSNRGTKLRIQTGCPKLKTYFIVLKSTGFTI